MTAKRRCLVPRTASLPWVLLLACLSGGCISPADWAYVGKLGYTQLNISLHSTPLRAALEGNADLTSEEKAKLALVLEVKEFCEQLGLHTEKVYDNYSSVEGTELFFMVASQRLRFELRQWDWPIVGRLPYKAFFGKDSASNEARKLAEQGFDVYIGRAGGYSTLGWFNDPFLPTMFRLDELALIEVVIHEAAHRNIFKKGFPSFNEGIATLIGREGMILFVRGRYGKQSPELRSLLARHAAERELEEQVNNLYKELNGVYTSSLSIDEKTVRRQEILSAYGPALAHRVEPTNLNNAWILLHRVYTEHLGTYREVHMARGGSLRRTIQFLAEVAESREDPSEVILRWLAMRVAVSQPAR